MDRTGLAAWVVADLVSPDSHVLVLTGVFCVAAVMLSTFMSNTAAANLLVPIAIALPDQSLVVPCALASALGSSIAVGLPVSTPPMLLAYSTGMVRTGELLKLGVTVGIAGTLLVVVCVTWLS
jgi:sodium-dependent dicarboxylate transporter 2/3/5